MKSEMTTAEMIEQCGTWAGFADQIKAVGMANTHRAIAARLAALDKVATEYAALRKILDGERGDEQAAWDRTDAALKEAGYGT